jgi:hypothetical protein
MIGLTVVEISEDRHGALTGEVKDIYNIKKGIVVIIEVLKLSSIQCGLAPETGPVALNPVYRASLSIPR